MVRHPVALQSVYERIRLKHTIRDHTKCRSFAWRIIRHKRRKIDRFCPENVFFFCPFFFFKKFSSATNFPFPSSHDYAENQTMGDSASHSQLSEQIRASQLEHGSAIWTEVPTGQNPTSLIYQVCKPNLKDTHLISSQTYKSSACPFISYWSRSYLLGYIVKPATSDDPRRPPPPLCILSSQVKVCVK